MRHERDRRDLNVGFARWRDPNVGFQKNNVLHERDRVMVCFFRPITIPGLCELAAHWSLLL